MVIEESSVVAAASNAAKFWSKFGGFHTEITSVTKVGQVHFTWTGETNKLRKVFPELKNRLIKKVKPITANMEERGGGIIDIQLLDKTEDMENYYQLFATFDTVDSMGANFINSCLEEFAAELKTFLSDSSYFTGYEKDVNIIMSILSNYTPECRVKCWVETDIKNLESLDNDLDAQAFAKKFEKAVQIATIDPFRATTHNKGIFNGIDAVILATGNDFRAIEAAGHAYASRKGKYQSLTKLSLDNNTFRYELELPLSLGTVGGLTRLHPLVVRSLELLDNPDAKQLMRITAAAGLANNFSAIKSLITKGIQIGHMKMHLLNILNTFDATSHEKSQAMAYFKNIKVSYANVADFISTLRKNRSN